MDKSLLEAMKKTVKPLDQREAEAGMVDGKQTLTSDSFEKMNAIMEKLGDGMNNPTQTSPKQQNSSNSGGGFMSQVSKATSRGGFNMSRDDDFFEEDRSHLMERKMKQMMGDANVPTPDLFPQQHKVRKPQQQEPLPQQQEPASVSQVGITLNDIQHIKKMIMNDIKDDIKPMIKEMVMDELLSKYIKKEMIAILKNKK